MGRNAVDLHAKVEALWCLDIRVFSWSHVEAGKNFFPTRMDSGFDGWLLVERLQREVVGPSKALV